MKKILITVVVALLILQPAVTIAASTLPSDKGALYKLISVLKKEITALEKLLAHQKRANKTANVEASNKYLHIPSRNEIEPSQFYHGRYEALYVVDSQGDLISIESTKIEHLHEYLWNRFVALGGESYIRSLVGEFRVYSNKNAPYDAFVERLEGEDTWILGINTYGLDLTGLNAARDMDELLIHELGHIILDENKSIFESFKDEFWGTEDRAHEARLARMQDEARKVDAAAVYAEDHADDFVSDYAAVNSLEDSVESFAHFVLYGDAEEGTEMAEKIGFFYRYADFVSLRARILRAL